MDYRDPPQVSRLLHVGIADSIIETLEREIRVRLPTDEADNLRTRLDYLAMAMCVVMQRHDPAGFDEAQRADRVREVMRMVEQYLSVWYMG